MERQSGQAIEANRIFGPYAIRGPVSTEADVAADLRLTEWLVPTILPIDLNK